MGGEAPVATRALGELAVIVRSKNAGPYRLTFDVLFDDEATFRAVAGSGAITRESVAQRLGVDPGQVTSLHTLEQGLAIKFTLIRPSAQCAPGEGDVYGCQQHAPLLDWPMPWPGPVS